jgi:hypothetical protein
MHSNERLAVSSGREVDNRPLGVVEGVMVCFQGQGSCWSKGFAVGVLSAA